MIIKKVTFNDFLEEFKKCGRENQFSHEGKRALYDYLNQISEDLEEPMQLDVIALCSEFTEYSSLQEFNNDYSYSIGEDIQDVEEIQDS